MNVKMEILKSGLYKQFTKHVRVNTKALTNTLIHFSIRIRKHRGQ